MRTMRKRSKVLRMVSNSLLVILIILVLVALVFVAYGREKSWTTMFGSPDLGAIDFQTLKNQRRQNQYLLCPDGFCPEAKPAAVSPVFSAPPDDLRAAIIKAALADNRVTQVSDGEEIRFVARTNLMRFPDTVSIRVLPAEGGSTLAIYSRSQIGRRDFDVNQARVERWLRRVVKSLGS